MAIYPGKYSTQDTLQPGARGKTFIETLPGYRTEEARIDRTNTHLNVSGHDVPNIKWAMDDRLPVLFRYGFAYGFNQIICPKGRIMALDPHKSMVEFESDYSNETKKQFNVLTVANGGVPVRLRKAGDKYVTVSDAKGIVTPDASGKDAANIGKEWTPLHGLDKAYTEKYYRPFLVEDAFKSPAKQLEAAGLKTDFSGNIVNEAGLKQDVRPGNIPIGVLERNEYTRDEDAYNGMMPGPILTDAMIEMPWFLYKDKAEANFWGSAYGNLYPGALVKADENGRFVLSPLSDPDIVADMSIGEYEAERRQVIGEVYSATQDLVPEGAAKWAVWSLEDRLNFGEFNPDTWKQTNRRNEDSQYSNLGIPGLTDGYNAVTRAIPEERIGVLHYRGDGSTMPYIDVIMKTSEVNIEKGTLQIKVGANNYVTVNEVGQTLDDAGAFTISYLDELQGLIRIHMDTDKADTALKAEPLYVYAKYNKRGLAGVPTFMDWDGVVGSCKILLTK